MKEYYRVKALISLDAIYKNIENTRKIIHDDTRIMAVLKADGYGHGAIPIAKTLDSLVDFYGTAIIEEGIELRRAGITKPILVLGFTPGEYYRELVEYNITQTIYQYDMALCLSKEAVRQGKTAKIHIKLDTGMSRIGFSPSIDSIKCIKKISQLEGISIEGIFTHFAKADYKDKTMAGNQLRIFLEFIDGLKKEEIHIPIKHASNSAGIIDMPEANLDMVRSGISTYGLYPSDEVNKERLPLVPALELKSYVIQVKELEKGTGVGYGSTYVTRRKTKVGTIPVGYGDGYPRSLSNIGRVLINGKSAPIIGRICMDQFMVDITDIQDAKTGDIVTLIGKDQDESISVEELADLAGSFNYEFVCDLGKRIPREFYLDGKKVGTLDYYNCTKDTLDFPLSI